MKAVETEAAKRCEEAGTEIGHRSNKVVTCDKGRTDTWPGWNITNSVPSKRYARWTRCIRSKATCGGPFQVGFRVGFRVTSKLHKVQHLQLQQSVCRQSIVSQYDPQRSSRLYHNVSETSRSCEELKAGESPKESDSGDDLAEVFRWKNNFDTTLARIYTRIQPAESLNLHMKLATETAGTNRIAKDRMLTVTPRTANDDAKKYWKSEKMTGACPLLSCFVQCRSWRSWNLFIFLVQSCTYLVILMLLALGSLTQLEFVWNNAAFQMPFQCEACQMAYWSMRLAVACIAVQLTIEARSEKLPG
jgi:hypothetical protein